MRNLHTRRLPAALAITVPLVAASSGVSTAASPGVSTGVSTAASPGVSAGVSAGVASAATPYVHRSESAGARVGSTARPPESAVTPTGSYVRPVGSVAVRANVRVAPSVSRALRALEAAFDGRIGAYAVDTATGRTVVYRSRERFPLLSTFKAMACAAVLHKARTSEPGLMSKVVRWSAAEVKPNSPVTAKYVKQGLSVARLCEAAITLSDNTAGNMLLKQIGGPSGLTRYLRTLKDSASRLDRWETELNDWSPGERRDTTTPAAMARGLRAVTVGTALHAKDRDRLNAWLVATETGEARIKAGLPSSWVVGHKTGTGGVYGTAHDVAVVWPDRTSAPIIMAIFTNRKASGADADEKIIARTATILARGLGRL
ncbi:class A beta-lactamase [Nonomuraea soli]|uniref:Beta-lactamase n=1 Tax=Nonomuraea soli TaxID=1032476 RepID=A0A7W0CD98_9ACTN|nr:class A beta-lactamase [Nonomuraea soli]MBA2889041.1 beta-lactamase class A [Nonomuraea soli]